MREWRGKREHRTHTSALQSARLLPQQSDFSAMEERDVGQKDNGPSLVSIIFLTVSLLASLVAVVALVKVTRTNRETSKTFSELERLVERHREGHFERFSSE